MGGLIARRLSGAVLTVFALLTFVFFAVRLTGSPVTYLLPFDFTKEQEQAVRHELRLDQPLVNQYGAFMSDVLHGNLGYSHRWKTSAASLVYDRLPYTLSLAGLAFALAVVVSVPLG